MLIFRYISKEIYSGMLATTLVLLLIFMLNQLVHYLNQAATGEITTRALFQIMSLQVPLLLGYLLPLGLYIGIFIALGRMYVDQEMTVLTSCGFSNTRLLSMVLFFSVVIAVLVSWLMLILTPRVEWYRSKILTDAMATASLQKILPGRFQEMVGGDRVFYAESVSRDHDDLFNVFLAEKKQAAPEAPVQWDILRAKEAYEIEPVPGQGRFLLFKDGDRYIGSPRDPDYQKIHFTQYSVRITDSPAKMRESIKYWSSEKLWNNQALAKARAELQWRLAPPLLTIILALIAVPLSRVNPRTGKFAKLLPAIIIYVIYADLLFVARAWVDAEKIPAYWGMWWVHGLFLLLGICLVVKYLYALEWGYYAETVRKTIEKKWPKR